MNPFKIIRICFLLADGATAGPTFPRDRLIPIVHAYEDPAREFWEITFRVKTYMDADNERPLSEFRLSRLRQHVNGKHNAMPVLFIFEVPRSAGLTEFTGFMLKVIAEANKVVLKYSVVIINRAESNPSVIRTSALPADTNVVLISANGNCTIESKSISWLELLRKLSRRKGLFHSRAVALIVEEKTLHSPRGYEFLRSLLRGLNQTDAEGNPKFLYSISVQKDM